MTHIVASICQSLLVMAALESAGAAFPLAVRARVIGHDIVGLMVGTEAPSYGVCLLIGFAIALPAAAGLARLTRQRGAPFWYAVAGATSVALVLHIIQTRFFYHLTLMEGTRGVLGYGSQLAAGALGGFVFHGMRRRRVRA